MPDSDLDDGVLKHVAIVREHLDESVPVRGVLCFVDADWPLIGGSFTTSGVEALWPKNLYLKLRTDGPTTTRASPRCTNPLPGPSSLRERPDCPSTKR